MRATIVHESRGRLRLRLRQKNLTLRQADLLETWLKGQPWVREAAVHERTGCLIVTFTGERETVLSALGAFTWAGAEASVALPDHSTRAMNREFQEKLVGKVAVKAAATLFLPAPLRIARVIWHMAPFLRKGLRCLGRRQIKGFRPAAGTLAPPAPSCSCWRSGSCWKTGQGRSLWPTWRRVCPFT